MNQKPNRPVTLVLGHRQMIFGVLTLVFLLWSFAAVTGFIGRVAFPAPVAAQPAMPGERVILVDSPIADAAGSERVIEVAPVGVETEPAPEPVAEPDVAATAGRLYLQVASVNQELAAVYAEYLSQRDIPAFVSNGPEKKRFWVMVGPIQDAEHLTEIQSALSAAGFDTL